MILFSSRCILGYFVIRQNKIRRNGTEPHLLGIFFYETGQQYGRDIVDWQVCVLFRNSSYFRNNERSKLQFLLWSWKF